MKKIISLTLALVLIIGSLVVFPASAESTTKTTDDGKFSYKILNDGTVRILNYLGTSKKIIIPDIIEGKKVTTARVKHYTGFSGGEYLKFGRYIKSIDGFTIGNLLSYKEFSVEKNNKYFSSNAGVIYNKEKTKIIAWPRCKKFSDKALNSVKYIGKGAFAYRDDIKSLKFGNKLRRIGEDSFTNCANLKTVVIPKTVVHIGKTAFAGCKNLSKINITGSQRLVIEDFAFSENPSLKSIKFPQCNETESGMSIFSNCENIKKVSFNSKCKTVLESCFTGCKLLKTVKLPSKLKTIAKASFLQCLKLKSITIPESVIKIQDRCLGFKLIGYYEKYEYKKIKGFVIKGVKGSAAHKYAKKYGLKFKEIK